MGKLIQTLQQINWDFSDYSSSKYPMEINSVHWYPASFPPLIPRFLISLLTQKGDLVLDPFGGAGTTAVEALKLNRPFIYNDLNPFAFDITDAKICAIKRCELDSTFLSDEDKKIDNYPLYDNELEEFIQFNSINSDVLRWFERSTLLELCQIFKVIIAEKDVDLDKYLVRKLAFSSILKPTCSQTEHYTYITDNCWPSVLKRKEARITYLDQIERIILSSFDFLKQFYAMNENGKIQQIIDNSLLHSGDARALDWINDNSVDFVLTSPPYLCANDYIKTMRLTDLFFPNGEFSEKVQVEIGPRRKRKSNAERTVNEFYNDMDKVFAQISRVLRQDKYFCLIMGQGKGKITKEYDTVSELENILIERYGFEKIFRTERELSHRRVRVGGVHSESVIVFKKINKEER